MSPNHGNDAADLGGAIASLVGSGLPIEQGLRAAARELPRGRTSRALAALAEKLARGQELDTALAAENTSLPPHLRALIAAGVRSLSLGRVLEEFVAAERQAADVHRKLLLAVSYPAVLLLLMSAVFAFFCLGVVPGLMQVYEDFDADLPGATLALAELSRSGYWMLIGNVAVLVVAWLFVWAAMRVPELRTLLVAVPLLGPAVHWASLARFCRLLSLLTEMKLPLPQALELAGRGCQDARLAGAARKVSAGVRRGATLSDALVARRQFPQSLVPMVRWGEQAAGGQAAGGQVPSTALADALRTAAEMFDGRMEAQLGLLRAVVPPLTFLLVFWGSAFLMSSTLLPLISLIEKLT